MFITINYWVVYGALLCVNLSQVFWGLSLKTSRKKESSSAYSRSFFSLIVSVFGAWSFPLKVMLVFGAITGVSNIIVSNSNNPSSEETKFLFIFCVIWVIVTLLISVAMTIKHFIKE